MPGAALQDDRQTDRAGPRSQTSMLQDRLRDDILHGLLEPGSKLKIEVLQKRYDTGSTPLREALTLLTASGLVRREDQRGFTVQPVSLEDFDELLHARCFLEERVLTDSIATGDAAWEDRVVLALHRLARAPLPKGEEDFPAADAWEARNRAFHAELVSACGSRVLLRFWSQLYDESKRYRYIARLVPRARSRALEEHRRIADAALARDAVRAVELTLEHYRRTGELMRARLSGRRG